MNTEDGGQFIKHLAYYVRTHEKALANAIQLRSQGPKQAKPHGAAPGVSPSPSGLLSPQPVSSTAASTLTSAFPYLSLGSSNFKPAKLYLTPNQLYFLLSRFEELGVSCGPMNVRLEDIYADSTSTNYVSFLTQAQRPKGRSADQDSLHSVSSVRSVMSSVSAMFSGFALPSSNSAAKIEKRKAAELEDLKYLYSAFTKIPCLKLVLDHRTPRIAGYEEFPFDTAVPVYAFKNVSVLEIVDLDFRTFFGWDRLAEQLRSLTVKRAGVDDVTDLVTNIVLDDMDKRRRRSARTATSPAVGVASPTATPRQMELGRSFSTPDSPYVAESRQSPSDYGGAINEEDAPGSAGSRSGLRSRMQNSSPTRPSTGRKGTSYSTGKKARRWSESSTSSNPSNTPRTSSSNLLLQSLGGLPSLKWRLLRHLSIADNGLTTISAQSLAPLASTLQSLDLSSNLFTEIPDSLASLVSLRALNLSNCMIESLQTLSRSPLPAINILNLRGNRFDSLAGIEKLLSLERLDLRENRLKDPAELARLTSMPEFREVYVLRNPFARSHANYRITIFNLFRQSPGYTEDVIIDSSGPGYSERRQLADRRPEPTNVPVVKPPLDDDQDHDGREGPPKGKEPGLESEIAAESSQAQAASGSVRNKPFAKQNRRRVVDMARDTPPQLPNIVGSSFEASPDATFVTAFQTPTTTERRRQKKSLDESLHQPSPEAPREGMSDLHNSSPDSLRLGETKRFERANEAGSVVGYAEISASSEQYRKRIETLKQEHGSSWLSALEEPWNSTSSGRSVSFGEKTFDPQRSLGASTAGNRAPVATGLPVDRSRS